MKRKRITPDFWRSLLVHLAASPKLSLILFPQPDLPFQNIGSAIASLAGALPVLAQESAELKAVADVLRFSSVKDGIRIDLDGRFAGRCWETEEEEMQPDGRGQVFETIWISPRKRYWCICRLRDYNATLAGRLNYYPLATNPPDD